MNESVGSINPQDIIPQPIIDYPLPDEVSFEREYSHAKFFLQKCSSITGDNLYDHLTNCLNKVLSERPDNVVDYFEDYSREVRQQRFKPLTDHLRDVYTPPDRFESTKALMPLFSNVEAVVDSEKAHYKINLLELSYYLEQAGVGLPKAEMIYINLSIKQLIREEPIADIRFWGKIFGIKKNYIIVECQRIPSENVETNEDQVEDNGEEETNTEIPEEPIEQDIDATDQEPDDWPPFPPLPQSTFREPEEPPAEPPGIGANTYVYYVCNEPNEKWIQLPDVTPKQIRIARQIVKVFTGDLDQDIVTYPVFPGKEREYLRAQIARISASTKIEYMEHPENTALPIKYLSDKSMNYWVHQSLEILEQGRTTLWHPDGQIESEEGDELNESNPEIEKVPNEEPTDSAPKPPTDPTSLASCSQDAPFKGIPPWSAHSSTNLLEDNTIAVVRSNLWPGAYTIATQNKQFYNIYIGNGLKITTPNFSPTPLPPVAQEYPLGPDISEISDPTGIEETLAELERRRIPPIEIPEEEENNNI